MCPAEGNRCHKCGQPDHFARKCTKANRVNAVGTCSSDSESEELFLGYICADINTVETEWSENIEINDRTVRFQLDTGAKCNVLPLTTFKELGLNCDQLALSKTNLKSYSGHRVKPVGNIILQCKYQDHVSDNTFEVVDLPSEPILGSASCSAMGLVKRTYKLDHAETTNIPKDIQSEYSDVFKGLGLLPVKQDIKIDPLIPPVIHPPRRVPIALRDKIKDELDRMEEAGVIVQQKEPTAWVNSMVTVQKPNGKLRICIDPKDLNKAIRREHYPLKTIEDVTQQITEAKLFSKLDTTSGFWQIGLTEESSKLCTFNSPYGRYRFTRLPFGIRSASEIYQRTISEMVRDLEGCEAIIDDILIWGKDRQEHDQRLKAVMNRIRDYNLKLSPEKCQFRKDHIAYVGHVFTSAGIQPDPEKIRAVKDMPAPQNISELQTFLGFIQYLGKF